MTATNRIPLPEHLAEPWEQPGDEHGFWTLDLMHQPQAISVLEDAIIRRMYHHGMSGALASYSMPLRADARRFWAHHYMSIGPLPLPHDELEAMGSQSEALIGQTMGRLMDRWETEWLPEVKEHLAFWENFDLRGASMPQLLAHLDETITRTERIWAIHFEVAFPMMLPISLLDEMYGELFGRDNPFAAYELLQGLDNMTLRGDNELWKLSRKAQATPEVRAIVADVPTPEVIAALEATEASRAFLADLNAYLAEYGQRGATWGIRFVSWIEDPTPVIERLKDYITQPDRDPALELAGLAAARDQRVAEARERIRTYPEAVRGQFEFLLKAAQDGIVLTEDHGFWIDFRSSYRVRMVFMELGRRFASAGAIESADDIFHLSLDEIRAAAASEPLPDLSGLVAERKDELARYSVSDLPPAVGTAPPGPPPDNPIMRTLGKFFGSPPQPSENADVLNGASGSPGVARGTARIVRTLADASRIAPGEILVTTTTAPPWTPLFASVAAVVTDTGGILSHCAVVAREYGIPAVVGVGFATAAIQDGQTIEVDGDRGVVRIVRES